MEYNYNFIVHYFISVLFVTVSFVSSNFLPIFKLLLNLFWFYWSPWMGRTARTWKCCLGNTIHLKSYRQVIIIWYLIFRPSSLFLFTYVKSFNCFKEKREFKNFHQKIPAKTFYLLSMPRLMVICLSCPLGRQNELLCQY